ncbi:MAG TPA: hypothetical protein VEU96_21640 [Bryobacteraceae bacterium]|nr:hypothetical protein [Bryobacteraceae bacterium]
MSTSAGRIESNQANAQHSTGPRTPAGKARSAMNALRHGLTAVTPVLPTEDLAAYNRHLQKLFDEYQPNGPTETILVHEIADTSWRMKRIPAIEAALVDRAANPPNEQAAIDFDVVDAHHAINALSVQSHRLHRQLHRTIDKLRYLQSERRRLEHNDLRECAAIYKLHKDKGLPYNPADDGFVFSEKEIDRYIDSQMRHGKARNMNYFLNFAPEKFFAKGF